MTFRRFSWNRHNRVNVTWYNCLERDHKNNLAARPQYPEIERQVFMVVLLSECRIQPTCHRSNLFHPDLTPVNLVRNFHVTRMSSSQLSAQAGYNTIGRNKMFFTADLIFFQIWVKVWKFYMDVMTDCEPVLSLFYKRWLDVSVNRLQLHLLLSRRCGECLSDVQIWFSSPSSCESTSLRVWLYGPHSSEEAK